MGNTHFFYKTVTVSHHYTYKPAHQSILTLAATYRLHNYGFKLYESQSMKLDAIPSSLRTLDITCSYYIYNTKFGIFIITSIVY